MTALTSPASEAWIAPEVWQHHPDYVAVLVTATGLIPGPSSHHSEALLQRAEQEATAVIGDGAAHDLPEVAAWREAYLSFGVRHRQARSSVESLMRRAGTGLPRIDRLTDVYNAISVLHRMPIGGEDLTGYVGPARLVVASGDEPFDTTADGETVTQNPTPGEIVWRDEAGVTCRRWNWRQCVRTRLTERTTDALFIIDGLGEDARLRAEVTAAALIESLAVDSPSIVHTTRTLAG